MLTFTYPHFVKYLPQLLEKWPQEGFRTLGSAQRVLASILEYTDPGEIEVPHYTTREELRVGGVRVAGTSYHTPWKYTKYFQNTTDLRKAAIKIRPGSILPVVLNGAETTAYVNKARRIRFRGKETYLKLDLNLNTEHVPIILERETKCTCLYCGTAPKSDETSCRSCGAPLPDGNC